MAKLKIPIFLIIYLSFCNFDIILLFIKLKKLKKLKKLRIYSDTSVIGGYFDKEFEKYSKFLK